MKSRKFTKQNHAVAGVIEALLLVGLVAVILSVIQFYYIPEVMTQREAEHMDEVANQFSFLKAIIDLQSIEKKDVPISSPITLGSRELPYFVTGRALGEIRVIENAGNISDGYDKISFRIPLTSIEYTAFNAYYLRDKGPIIIYTLEGGAIILKQPDGEQVIIEPTIKVTVDDSINIYYEIPIIIGISGKTSSPQDYKTCFVRTNYSDKLDDEGHYTFQYNMTISTNYVDAWSKMLNNITNLANNVNISKNSNSVVIKKLPESTKEIKLYYKKNYIYAQISPGWIKILK